MERGLPYIQLKVEVDQPLELGDFVGAFTALGAEFERYMRAREAEGDSHAKLYVREVRQGSIVADLLPYLATFGGLADGMQQIMAVEDFVKRYGGRLLAYRRVGGRAEDMTKSALEDFNRQVAAIAHHPKSKLSVAAIEIKNGDHHVRAAFEFDTGEARVIQEQVEIHKYEIEHQTGHLHERVLMTFTRSDVRTTAVGKRSGEQVRIEDISHRSMPIIYASDLAERQIKYEITEAEDNVYKKGFVVDVAVERRQGRVVAYRIMHLHQIIDLPDDDSEDGEPALLPAPER
jgi:hypothetical protein